MKSVFCKREHHERVIMAVTSLPKGFLGYDSDKSMVKFFTQFGFTKTVVKIRKQVKMMLTRLF